MEFINERALARKLKVACRVGRTKTGCPHLMVWATGKRVSFVPAVGGETFHVYLLEYGTWEQTYLGVHERERITEFIRTYGTMKDRDGEVALNRTRLMLELGA